VSRLNDDTYSCRGAVRRAPGRFSALLFVLLFAAVALLALSRLQHAYVTDLRLRLTEAMLPALHAASVTLQPFRRLGRQATAYFDQFAELDRLRAENQRLKSWEWRAQELERRMSALAQLARVVEEPALHFITARVVTDASGPFVRSAMLRGGRDQGVRSGYPVISADGLVGRIVESGARASRVLLFTDLNSRIPVLVGPAQVRAIIVGDNGPYPRLAYLSPNSRIEPGDEVYTSGVGGLYPRGLRIGTAAEEAGSYRVVPHARLDELDFVSVLFFDTPTSELVEDDRSPPREQRGRRSVAGRPDERPAGQP